MNSHNDMILNECTGRYVYIHGRIGKHILKHQKNNVKYMVLQYKHIRKLVISYIVYSNYEDFCISKTEQYYTLMQKTKNINIFYKKTKLLLSLNTFMSFNEIHLYYIEFMKKNIRYNLYNNVEELITKNKIFCKNMNKILRKRNSYYVFSKFHKFMYTLNNSIVYSDTKHKVNLKKYTHYLIFSHRVNMYADLTVFW